MKYTTTIKAIDPKTGELKEWMGPVIDAISFKHAKRYCNENLNHHSYQNLCYHLNYRL